MIKLARSSKTLRKNVIEVSKIGSEMNLLTNSVSKEKLRSRAARTAGSSFISGVITETRG